MTWVFSLGSQVTRPFLESRTVRPRRRVRLFRSFTAGLTRRGQPSRGFAGFARRAKRDTSQDVLASRKVFLDGWLISSGQAGVRECSLHARRGRPVLNVIFLRGFKAGCSMDDGPWDCLVGRSWHTVPLWKRELQSSNPVQVQCHCQRIWGVRYGLVLGDESRQSGETSSPGTEIKSHFSSYTLLERESPVASVPKRTTAPSTERISCKACVLVELAGAVQYLAGRLCRPNKNRSGAVGSWNFV